MNIEWRGPLPTTNYMAGRSGNPITVIVDHWVGSGTLESAEARFKKPGEQVSAHFGIGTDGRIVQWVALEDTAFHSGQFQANCLSVGIEHEATPGLAPSDALYRSSAWLHRHLSEHYGIRLEVGRTVRPHNYYKATQCPGTLDLTRIVREAQEDDMDIEELRRVIREEIAASAANKEDVRTTFEAVKKAFHEHTHSTTTPA